MSSPSTPAPLEISEECVPPLSGHNQGLALLPPLSQQSNCTFFSLFSHLSYFSPGLVSPQVSELLCLGLSLSAQVMGRFSFGIGMFSFGIGRGFHFCGLTGQEFIAFMVGHGLDDISTQIPGVVFL